MKVVQALLDSASLVALWAVPAEARSSHERVEIKEMKSGGKVVGMRIKLTLRPDNTGYQTVRIGLAPTSGISDRTKASDKSKGALLHQWPDVKGIQNNTPKEVTVEVKYADLPNLKPGDQFRLITAWGDNPRNKGYFHLWGRGTQGQLYKAPGSQSQAQNLARRARKAPRTKALRLQKSQRPASATKSKFKAGHDSTRAAKRKAARAARVKVRARAR